MGGTATQNAASGVRAENKHPAPARPRGKLISIWNDTEKLSTKWFIRSGENPWFFLKKIILSHIKIYTEQ